MEAASWGLLTATFLACFVEMVEATTIVMAMGFTRGWKSAIAGTLAALGALVVVTVAAGYALATWLPESALQLLIGGLLLIFGLQWLRKAVLRSSGRKAMHDEDEIYREEVEAARAQARDDTGIDMFGFMVSFKGVFLEGVEVVFIVITFGLNADDVPLAAVGRRDRLRPGAGSRGGAAQAAGDDPREHPEVRRRTAAGGVRHVLGRRGSRHLPRRAGEPGVAARGPGPARADRRRGSC